MAKTHLDARSQLESDQPAATAAGSFLRSFRWWVSGSVIALSGVAFLVGGMRLARLGGSFYYVAAGVLWLLAGLQLTRRKQSGLLLYVLALVLTFGWALNEVGFDLWQLVPRLGWPLAVGIITVLLVPGVRWGKLSASALGLIAIASFAFAARDAGPRGMVNEGRPSSAPAAPTSWPSFGGSTLGLRYSSAAQINRENVSDVRLAWSYRTGDLPENYPKAKAAFTFETTPIEAGGRLVFCTPHGIVIALDPDTGKQLWRFDPAIDERGAPVLACRGVAHFVAQENVSDCAERIIYGTLDGRLIALNASNGRLCAGFGAGGVVSLREGLGEVAPGTHGMSSPPMLVKRAVIVGGFIMDNIGVGEPAGVIRAYDAIDGRLLWAWDSAGPLQQPASAAHGEYVRSSPNGWSVFAADPDLGMVYVPLGNTTPDFVGSHRSAGQERHASAIVALEAASGRLRWSFQTVHHDIWDYDIGAPPVLADVPTPDGLVPALIQATKHGEIFLLDRRTGKPLAAVEERRAPQGALPGERYAPTQPWSIGMPSLSPKPLNETDMWGMTPFDQLWCRIRFRSLDYAGKFTPPSLRGSLQYPGNFGVVDWGGLAFDPNRQLLIAAASYLPLEVRLLERKKLDPRFASLKTLDTHAGFSPQLGTPYAVTVKPFLSPLGIPCHAPPWGTLIAIDMHTRQVLWSQPFGTTRDVAPLGISIKGVFNLGGATMTASGLVFIGAAIDDYLRAFDVATGRELWRARLPAGGQAGTMTYVSSRSGRQYVVIAAGGHQYMGTRLGDYILAYSLPDRLH